MNFKDIFSTNIADYMQYLILTTFLFFAFYAGDYFLKITEVSPFWMFIYWFVIVSIADQLIKYAINVT